MLQMPVGAQMNLSAPGVAPQPRDASRWDEGVRVRNMKGWRTDGDAGCSILSSSPEIIRRAVTKWNVPRVMTAPGNALVDRTTELRESCCSCTNYFSRVVTLWNYCVAISGSRKLHYFALSMWQNCLWTNYTKARHAATTTAYGGVRNMLNDK